MTALKCDRCGKLYEENNCPTPIHELGVTHPDSNEYFRMHDGREEYDLCPECRKSLMIWFKEVQDET